MVHSVSPEDRLQSIIMTTVRIHSVVCTRAESKIFDHSPFAKKQGERSRGNRRDDYNLSARWRSPTVRELLFCPGSQQNLRTTAQNEDWFESVYDSH